MPIADDRNPDATTAKPTPIDSSTNDNIAMVSTRSQRERGKSVPCEGSPLVTFSVSRTGPRCPFGNSSVEFNFFRGGCVWLSGHSGAGKSTLSTYLAGLSSDSDLRKLDIKVDECSWDSSLARGERCGVLFQQTTLLDSLTVAGNVCVALEACATQRDQKEIQSARQRDFEIKRLIELVGLDYARDGSKRPTELSGGMARRASLALQLAQRKHLIVLDEPFTGLDRDSAVSVAKALVHLRRETGTALLLISHEPDLAALVMDNGVQGGSESITLDRPDARTCDGVHSANTKPCLFGRTVFERFCEKLGDYFLWSVPLISLTFVACGLAISMLSSDILRRIDVTEPVLAIVDKEVRPLIKMLTSEDPGAMTMMMINMKVRGMLNSVVPGTKATLYALGMAKLFVLEIGPLVTALLLSGRIGGSYAGEVATMQATAQNKLLVTLGVNPRKWSLIPALSASLIAAPLLTVLGTALALWLGGLVGPSYGIGTYESYVTDVRSAILPGLRLRSIVAWVEEHESSNRSLFDFFLSLDLRCTVGATGSACWDTFIEIITYPPCFLFVKSSVFMTIVVLVSEHAARRRKHLTPRNVPGVITQSVVMASLAIIVADWGFSQLLLKRQ